MRLNEYRKDPRQWKCALCCHVRTGTIIYGLLHLILHISALFLISVILIQPGLLNKDNQRNEVPTESTPQTQDVDQLSLEPKYSFFSNCNWTTHDVNIALTLALCFLAITMLMIYGAVKGKAAYLLPFFCVQVFDFCIASLSVIAYFSYMPDIRQVILNDTAFPFREQLLQLDSSLLSFATLVFFIVIMMIKAYFVGVVWACYRYLVHLQEDSFDYVDSASQVLLPPDYATVTKDDKQYHIVPFMMTSPPPYTSSC